MNKFKSLLSIAAFAVLAACGGASPDAGPPPLEGARMGGAFSLMNQDGKTVTDKDFAGKYRLIYFGYSFCPDVCPVDAQVMGRALSRFSSQLIRLAIRRAC
jgi:protein SCO1/2